MSRYNPRMGEIDVKSINMVERDQGKLKSY